MLGVLDAHLDVLRCAHCRSPKVESKATQLTRGSRFCLCQASGGESRGSAKKWNKYERRRWRFERRSLPMLPSCTRSIWKVRKGTS